MKAVHADRPERNKLNRIPQLGAPGLAFETSDFAGLYSS